MPDSQDGLIPMRNPNTGNMVWVKTQERKDIDYLRRVKGYLANSNLGYPPHKALAYAHAGVPSDSRTYAHARVRAVQELLRSFSLRSLSFTLEGLGRGQSAFWTGLVVTSPKATINNKDCTSCTGGGITIRTTDQGLVQAVEELSIQGARELVTVGCLLDTATVGYNTAPDLFWSYDWWQGNPMAVGGKDVDLLILANYDVGFCPEFVLEAVVNVIETRVAYELPTILTLSGTVEEMSPRYPLEEPWIEKLLHCKPIGAIVLPTSLEVGHED